MRIIHFQKILLVLEYLYEKKVYLTAAFSSELRPAGPITKMDFGMMMITCSKSYRLRDFWIIKDEIPMSISLLSCFIMAKVNSLFINILS